MYLLDEESIFGKSDKGKEEVAKRQHGLSSRQRQLLIIFDGIKTLEEVRSLVMYDDFDEDVQRLLRAALIVRKDGECRLLGVLVPSDGVPIEPLRPTIDGNGQPHQFERVRKLKEFMIGAMQANVGLLGTNLMKDIDGVSNFFELSLVVGEWYLALRESKRGGLLADSYLEHVRAELHAPSKMDCEAA